MTRSPLSPRSPLSHVCFVLLAAGCRDVLGINDAEFNPGLASSGGSGSSPGAVNGGTESASGGAPDAAGDAGENGESGAGADSNHGGDSGADSVDGGQAGQGGRDEPPPPSPLCQAYCGTITLNCSGDLAQYTDFDSCLSVCSALPEGSWGDDASNTVRCRLNQAQKATGDDAFSFCHQAGPSGGGKCGAPCDAYCAVTMAFCTSESSGGVHYFPSTGSCKQSCRFLTRDDDPYSVTLHSTGAHLQCRLFHACAAAGDPKRECAAALGGPPCQASD